MKNNQHKPNCAINQQCLVDHQGKPCPGYKPCDCGVGIPKPKGEDNENEIVEEDWNPN